VFFFAMNEAWLRLPPLTRELDDAISTTERTIRAEDTRM
jgi:hypothetical protein